MSIFSHQDRQRTVLGCKKKSQCQELSPYKKNCSVSVIYPLKRSDVLKGKSAVLLLVPLPTLSYSSDNHHYYAWSFFWGSQPLCYYKLSMLCFKALDQAIWLLLASLALAASLFKVFQQPLDQEELYPKNLAVEGVGVNTLRYSWLVLLIFFILHR